MKIIIPMTGLGMRFIKAGYKQIKPLIPIHSKPMVEHVIDLFPGETDFLFLCREEHLNSTPLAQVLKTAKPTGTILSLKGEKLGPVFPVTQAFDAINDDEPVIVSYCDYFMNWDYIAFKKRVEHTGSDGDVVCYTGFHPHLRHAKNIYAGCLINAKKQLLTIQEKHAFGDNKMTGYHSAGLYYFKKGRDIKTYFPKLIKANRHINGEFFVSMVYQLMLEDQCHITVFDEITHFCQWGTPEDLEEYLDWEKIMKRWPV